MCYAGSGRAVEVGGVLTKICRAQVIAQKRCKADSALQDL